MTSIPNIVKARQAWCSMSPKARKRGRHGIERNIITVSPALLGATEKARAKWVGMTVKQRKRKM